MPKYKHLFFDLDHTLWDFNRNSKETLSELFEIHKLELLNKFSLPLFLSVYEKVNERLWEHYRQHKITKEYLRNGRFIETLETLNHEDEALSIKLSNDYILRSPYKGILFPYVHETLKYLKSKYDLHIITNGFSEVQRIKMESAGLLNYFNHIFISEEVGFNKPDPAIFNHAVKTCKSNISRCLMVGDNIETDMKGASSVKMDHVFFNPEKLHHVYPDATFEIDCLSSLQKIL